VDTTLDLPVQVNGKLRGKVTVPADADQETILNTAASEPSVKPWLDGKTIVKKLYVERKLVNFVVK
jgi:leucyl-tRNA synthetase